jgi:hypothetical protein
MKLHCIPDQSRLLLCVCEVLKPTPHDTMLHFISGKLYAVGGSDGSHSLCSTEIYCPQEKIWTPGPNMTTSRANVGVAVIGSRLYAVGGFSGMAMCLVYEGKSENKVLYLIATK